MAYMIAALASVTVVEDGKRKTIPAGKGYDFTDEDIAAVNRVTPGALRAPLNETREAAEADVSEDGEGSIDESKTISKNGTGSKTVAGKAKRTTANNRKAKNATPAPAADEDEDEDEDAETGADSEDEDI